MNKIIISTIAASLLTISTAQAFDDQREGFLMGVGAGAAIVNTSSTGLDESSFGFATSFRMGYGFNNQFLLYYTNDISWFGIDDYRNDDTFISGGSAIGASYYIEENSPIYITGSLGLGGFSNFTSDYSTDLGSTFSIGGGYEISPHVLLEASYQRTNADNYNEGYGAEMSTNAFKFTVNYLWY